MNNIGRAFILLLIWSSVGYMRADTRMSTEGAMLYRMTTALKIYPMLHSGQPVKSWAQVREVYDLDAANKNLRGKPSYPLEDHYEFVAHPVPFPRNEGSEVAMIRTVPLQRAEGQPKWRYLIGRTKDGNLTVTHRSEDEVQTMFRQAGVPLPTPKAGLAAVEIEAMSNLDEPPGSIQQVAKTQTQSNLLRPQNIHCQQRPQLKRRLQP